MTAPDIRVYLGFGSTWQTEPGSISWTEVTSYVHQPSRVRIDRGASSARGEVDVGTLNLALLNADRRFDPTHSSGPYFGDLLPGVPIKVEADFGTDLAVGYGSVAKWPQRYDIGNQFAWVPLGCFDGFDKLARSKIPRSVMESAVMPLDPVGYWPLDDPSGSTTATDVTGANPGIAFDEPDFGGTPLAPGLGSSVRFDGVNDRIDISRSPIMPFRNDWTIVSVIRTDVAAEVDSEHPIFMQVGGNNSADIDAVFLHTDGKIVRYGFAAGAGFAMESEVAVDDGETHLVICGRDLVGGLYGVAVDTAVYYQAFVSGFTQSGNGVAIGGTPLATRGHDDNYFEGSISNVAVFDYPLTEMERQTIVDAYGALDGQRTDERIAWILDELGWPANLRDFEEGRTTLGPATFKPGDGALAYLRLVAASEDGLLYVAPDGMLTFRDRYWKYLSTEATTSQHTFSDSGDGDEEGYAEFDLDLDDELIVNVARFTRRDGNEQVAVDQTSVDLYGEAELQQSNLLQRTDAEVLSLAEWTVATRSAPLPRVPKIRIPLHRYTSAAQQSVLALDLGYRVTAKRTPQGVGTEIEIDFLVDGIRHDIGEGEWWVDLFVSPVPQETAELFLLDSSLLDGADILAY